MKVGDWYYDKSWDRYHAIEVITIVPEIKMLNVKVYLANLIEIETYDTTFHLDVETNKKENIMMTETEIAKILLMGS